MLKLICFRKEGNYRGEKCLMLVSLLYALIENVEFVEMVDLEDMFIFF